MGLAEVMVDFLPLLPFFSPLLPFFPRESFWRAVPALGFIPQPEPGAFSVLSKE